MKIEFTNSGILSESENLKASLTTIMSKELIWLSFQITQLEVQLSNKNDQPDGHNKKQCMLEARLDSRQSIKVTNGASCYVQAVNGAITKLKSSYLTIFGRVWNN